MIEVAIVSDTHLSRGARHLPDACLERCAAAGAIFHAGDLIELGVLEQLQALGPPVHAVHGNVDVPAVVAALPATLEVDVGEVRFGMVHDAGAAAGRLGRLRRRFPTCDVVLFGHSHIPLHESDGAPGAAAFQIFNPGSPTDRRRQPRHTMGVARIDGAEGHLTHVVVA